MKTYFYKGKKLALGTRVNINGLFIFVTPEFIELNLKELSEEIYLKCISVEKGVLSKYSKFTKGSIYCATYSNKEECTYITNELGVPIADYGTINVSRGVRINDTFTQFIEVTEEEYKNSFKDLDYYVDKFIKETSSLSEKNVYRFIFQEIAKDLSPKFTPDFDVSKYFISITKDGEIKIREHSSVKYDLVYFSSEKNAKKAIEIMGDKIKYVV